MNDQAAALVKGYLSHSGGFAIVDLERRVRAALRDEYKRGAEAAANVAQQFDHRVDHPYRIDDVILCKLNLRPGRPRKKLAKAPGRGRSVLRG